MTVRRTTVLSRNVCLGASTSGGVSDVTFEDMILGEQGSMPSLPWVSQACIFVASCTVLQQFEAAECHNVEKSIFLSDVNGGATGH